MDTLANANVSLCINLICKNNSNIVHLRATAETKRDFVLNVLYQFSSMFIQYNISLEKVGKMRSHRFEKINTFTQWEQSFPHFFPLPSFFFSFFSGKGVK